MLDNDIPFKEYVMRLPSKSEKKLALRSVTRGGRIDFNLAFDPVAVAAYVRFESELKVDEKKLQKILSQCEEHEKLYIKMKWNI